jgi:hypothetical protein
VTLIIQQYALNIKYYAVVTEHLKLNTACLDGVILTLCQQSWQVGRERPKDGLWQPNEHNKPLILPYQGKIMASGAVLYATERVSPCETGDDMLG